MSFVDSYCSTSSITARRDPGKVAAFISGIVESGGNGLSIEQRRKATRALLDLLGARTERDGVFQRTSLLHATTALKTLGRTAEGTEDLASGEGLGILLELAKLNQAIEPSSQEELIPEVSEAVRCLANVLLLHDSARKRLVSFPNVTEAVLCMGLPPATLMTQFLAARLLFLTTVEGSDIVRKLVEELDIAKYLSNRMLLHLPSLSGPTSPDAKLKSDILIEHLKFLFNLTLFYPRIVKEARSPQQSPAPAKSPSPSQTLSPNPNDQGSSSSRSSSRSRSPSPDIPKEKPKSCSKSGSSQGKTRTEKVKGFFSRKSREETRTETTSGGVLQADVDELKQWGFEDVVSSLATLALCLPFGVGSACGPFGLYKQVITSLLNFNVSTYSSTLFAPLSPFTAPPIASLPSTSPSRPEPSLPPLPARLLSLLDRTCEYYIPYGPDDDDARERAEQAPDNLDEGLTWLILLLTKLVAEDAKGDVRRGVKLCLLADDIDRSVGLDRRTDLTGRLVRLMSSSYLPQCNDAAGKFLFALCDQNPSEFAATLGYGNASGFLSSINMLVPPTSLPMRRSSSDSSSGSGSHQRSSSQRSNGTSPKQTINPITGAVEEPLSVDEPKMSEEEKEREAERLFVLFDRMNKNPAIQVQNPITEAKQSGRFEEISRIEDEKEAKRLQEEEDEDEREAMEEMKRYKERKSAK